MHRFLAMTLLCVLLLILSLAPPVDSACCYFAAKDKDILQPAQKAFITWDSVEKVETFTVQPKFEGNAADFGMVIPTPSRPKLDEMPRDFFKELAVFTILEPMDLSKYKQLRFMSGAVFGGVDRRSRSENKSSVKVLESGVVGSLDYKIIQADRADDLFNWLKDNRYSYAGDEATLDHYIRKAFFFTVMKIDPMQMKRRADGSYEGEVTPTRFTFASDKPMYPLKITQISVKDKTEALFYVQAPMKMDLAGDFSYQLTWAPMWNQAMDFAIPEKLTPEEVAWRKVVAPELPSLTARAAALARQGRTPSALEWAKKITENDILVLEGKRPYNREAPRADIDNLKLLRGHVQKGQFITKFRKIFTRAEMGDDLELVPATLNGAKDAIEYWSILPTSPP